MRFNSVHFLFFLPVAVMGYFILPDKAKNKWLLVLSYYFYMCWNAVYALLMLFSTFSTWVCSNFVSKKDSSEVTKKLALTVNLIVNLGILFFFKYYGMFTDMVVNIFSTIGISVQFPVLSLLLPVGISFYTFQALGYSIDVYRGTVEHERNFFDYALFVSFFPQLVAGPIERSGNLLPQFHNYNKFSYENYKIGMRLMLIGFFKKIVIADHISVVLERYYDKLELWPGPLLVVGVLLFAIQVYCDFSAYSDIARGSAKILGFDLMMNFDHPYFSKSIAEFWRRWHISLGGWFRDYLFYPVLRGKLCSNLTRKLTKAKKRKLARVLPIMIAQLVVWATTGLWHGAAWTYVAWGILHGVYQIIENIISVYGRKDKEHLLDRFPKFKSFVQICFTFFLVCIGYVFFRSESFSQAWYILSHSVTGWGTLLTPVQLMEKTIFLFGSMRVILITVISTAMLLVLEITEVKTDKYFPQLMDELTAGKRWFVYYVMLFAIALFGCFEASAFIYFQF